MAERESSLSIRVDESQQENEMLKKKAGRLQRVLDAAVSLLKFALKLVPKPKLTKHADCIRKFEELAGEKIIPIEGPEVS